MANCLYLHYSYITKFDFMNYAFAKLVLAWLYLLTLLINISIEANSVKPDQTAPIEAAIGAV